jgi:hypothetical protein
MNDKALLELAAKAAGISSALKVPYVSKDGLATGWTEWNPLTDDGDALRLAVKLQIIVGKYDDYANAAGIGNDVDIVIWNHEEKDPYAATRRAIVRAAAEIGKEQA